MIEGRIADLEIRVLHLEGKLEEIRKNIIGLESLGTEAYHSTLEGILSQIEKLTAMVARVLEQEARLIAMVGNGESKTVTRDADLGEEQGDLEAS